MFGGGPEYLMMIVLIFLFDHDTITTQHITSHTQSGIILPQPLSLTFGLDFRLLDFWFEIFFLIYFKNFVFLTVTRMHVNIIVEQPQLLALLSQFSQM